MRKTIVLLIFLIFLLGFVLFSYLKITGFAVSKDSCEQLYNLVNEKQGYVSSDAGYDSRADIDKDGEITLIDMIEVDNKQRDNDFEWCSGILNKKSVGGGGGDRKGSKSGGSNVSGCTQNWKCEWGKCENNMQKKTCTDLNNCGTSKGKPAEETKACQVKSEEIDSRDGGMMELKDIATKTEEKWKDFLKKSLITIITVILSLLIIVVVILIVVYAKKYNKNANKSAITENFKRQQTQMEEAKKFVNEARQKGFSEELIKRMFLDKGWKEEDINDILNF